MDTRIIAAILVAFLAGCLIGWSLHGGDQYAAGRYDQCIKDQPEGLAAYAVCAHLTGVGEMK